MRTRRFRTGRRRTLTSAPFPAPCKPSERLSRNRVVKALRLRSRLATAPVRLLVTPLLQPGTAQPRATQHRLRSPQPDIAKAAGRDDQRAYDGHEPVLATVSCARCQRGRHARRMFGGTVRIRYARLRTPQTYHAV